MRADHTETRRELDYTAYTLDKGEVRASYQVKFTDTELSQVADGLASALQAAAGAAASAFTASPSGDTVTVSRSDGQVFTLSAELSGTTGGSAAIDDHQASGAAAIEVALEQLNSVGDVQVTGSGRVGDPWRVTLLPGGTDADEEGRFFRLYSTNEDAALAYVARGTVTRVDSDFVGQP